MLSVVVSLALALVPHGTAAHSTPATHASQTTHAAPSAEQRANGFLPTRGVLIVGKSLARVSLGMTQPQVKAILGGNYTNCITAPCKDPTWLYFYHSGEPLGMGVRFKNNKAVAIFTLGAVPGWKSQEGLKVADPASKAYELYGNPKYGKCIGYEALSLPRTGVVTSFYLTSGVVYGFALTVPGLSVCQ